MIQHITNENIIDLGCGDGFYTRILNQKTTGKVFGVDISNSMIESARSLED